MNDMETLLGDGKLFLLKVHGDATAAAGITDGDWVVIREQSAASAGDLVAVMVAGDVILRTCHDDKAPVVGKVVAVVRRV